MYSEFNAYNMLIASHYIDTFKPDVYVSQLYFNAINKVARYTVQHKSSTIESQANLKNNQRFIKVSTTKL